MTTRQPTQDEMRQRFGDLLRYVVEEINYIDRHTPATPTTEPQWWQDMMDLRSEAYDLHQRYPDSREPWS